LHDFLWEVIGTDVSCYAYGIATGGHDLVHDGVLLFNINAKHRETELVFNWKVEVEGCVLTR
jgi:hypothetical protein